MKGFTFRSLFYSHLDIKDNSHLDIKDNSHLNTKDTAV